MPYPHKVHTDSHTQLVPLGTVPEGHVKHPRESQVAQVGEQSWHTPLLRKVPLRQAVQAKGEGVQAVQSDNRLKHDTALLVGA